MANRLDRSEVSMDMTPGNPSNVHLNEQTGSALNRNRLAQNLRDWVRSTNTGEKQALANLRTRRMVEPVVFNANTQVDHGTVLFVSVGS